MTYVYQEYPKWIAEGKIANNAEEEKAMRAALGIPGSPSAELPSGAAADGGAAANAPAPSAPVGLEAMTKAELIEHAQKEHGLELKAAMSKAELIEAIGQAKGQ